MHQFQVDVKGYKEDEVNNQLTLEKVSGIGIPFVVNDDLDRLLLEQLKIGRIFERFHKFDLIFALDLVEINIIKHHLILLTFGLFFLCLAFFFFLFLLIFVIFHFLKRHESFARPYLLLLLLPPLFKISPECFEVSVITIVLK